MIPDKKLYLDKRCYNGVYVLLQFNKENGVDRKEDQANTETDPDEE